MVKILYMLRADYKLEQFVNGPLVYKPVIPFLNLLAHFSNIQSEVVPFENLAKWCEDWLNGLEAGWLVYKYPEWHESCTNLPNKPPMTQMTWNLAEWFTEATSKVVSQTRPNQCHHAHTKSVLRWHCFGPTWKKLTTLDRPHIVFCNFFPVAAIGRCERLLTTFSRC